MRDLPTGTVTLLFTDIEGSTHLLQQLGEGYAGVLIECRELLRGAFSQHHGYEVDTQGDAFFVAFTRASDAVSAAVAAQRALASHNFAEGVAVAVRMGLHTGEPSVGAEGYIGLDVHHAARIMSAGHGGQILLSQTTRDLVEHDLPDRVSLRDHGEHRLKDLQRPAHLYQLVIADLPANFPPLKTLDSHPNNLPIQLTRLIGREKEITAVRYLFQREDVRLMTLTGSGGTGKTRLGLQVAAELSDQFIDGVYFVNLAPISDPTLVVSTIAQTLDLKETGEQPLFDLLKGYLQDKEVLLLLDNFEQVASAALHVADLLAGCTKLKVIVTSRAVLHVRGEQEFPVPPLVVPDPKRLPDLVTLSHYEAVELFVSRAQAVKPEFQLSNTNAPAIAEICARLDGLPLAIELASARIKLLPPQALLTRLGQRFAVLTSGPHDAPARQQTLRNTIAWSYNLLDAQEQRLFRRLAVFVGGCTLEAIEAVCTALDGGHEAVSVLEGIASLLNKSLLQQMEPEGSEPRLVMLQTIREYGLECLTVCGEKDACQQAHAHYYLSWTEQAESELEGPRQAAWFKSLELEHDNLRAVLQWSIEQGESRQSTESIEIALRLAGALREFWIGHGHYSEGRAFLEQALRQSRGFQTAVRMKALIAAGALANLQGDSDLAKMLCEESLALGRELGDKQGIALSLYGLGCIAWDQGQYEEAHKLLNDALACWREMGDKKGIAWSLFQLASILLEQGEYARALSFLKESLANQREVGNKTGIANSLFMLAQALFEIQEDPTSVRSLLEEGLELFRELDNKWGLAASFYLSGKLALVEGDTGSASSLLEECVIRCREMGGPEFLAESLIVLGRVRAIQGNHAVARSLYEESLAMARSVNARVTISLGLEGLAGAVATQGELVWAARLWGAADSLRQAIGAPLSPVERARYEQEVTAARTQLEEEAFKAAWAEGRNMTPEQALATQGPVTLPQPFSAAPSPTTSPGGLSVRELEVLRLLATGLTDAQIAEQLVLSLHTIHAHLRTIYSKLGVTSRSAATRYAFEHQLV